MLATRDARPHHARRCDEPHKTRLARMNWWQRVGYYRAALLLWAVPLAVITVMVIARPHKRTVFPLYREASLAWMGQAPLYEGPSGMNYLPCFAVLFAPIAVLPTPVADLAWRYLMAALLIAGLWRMARAISEEGAPQRFLVATVLVLPLSLGALRNGQANAMFAALSLLAAAALAARQWNLAAVWLTLSLAVKPLGAVFLALAMTLFPPVRWRVLLGVFALVVLPFVFAPATYAIEQYQAFGENIRACSQVTEHRFADLNGILRTFGAELPPRVALLLRAGAGLATVLFCWVGGKRLSGSAQALWAYALATGYLMLFNPMTETNSYVIAVPAMAFWAERFFSQRETRATGWLLAAIVVALSVFSPLRSSFKLFWYPALTLVFVVALSGWALRRKPEAT